MRQVCSSAPTITTTCFEIVEAIRSKRLLDKDKSASLAIGLKLFSEVILEMRKDQMFAPLVLPIRNFIEQLKRVKVEDRAGRPPRVLMPN